MIDNVDDRLLEHWRRVRAAGELAQAARRASLRDDPDAKIHEVRGTSTQAMLHVNRSSRLIAISNDDR
jgi:hypothetical protein